MSVIEESSTNFQYISVAMQVPWRVKEMNYLISRSC